MEHDKFHVHFPEKYYQNASLGSQSRTTSNSSPSAFHPVILPSCISTHFPTDFPFGLELKTVFPRCSYILRIYVFFFFFPEWQPKDWRRVIWWWGSKWPGISVCPSAWHMCLSSSCWALSPSIARTVSSAHMAHSLTLGATWDILPLSRGEGKSVRLSALPFHFASLAFNYLKNCFCTVYDYCKKNQ